MNAVDLYFVSFLFHFLSFSPPPPSSFVYRFDCIGKPCNENVDDILLATIHVPRGAYTHTTSAKKTRDDIIPLE